MELAYQSQKDPKLTENLSQLDKMYRSILHSVKDMPTNSLPKQTKQRICRLLQKDAVYRLSKYLRKQAIQFHTEVGTTGSCWNIIHFCVKYNSVESLQYILKSQYQDFSEGYFELVNSRTVQEYTPLVIAIINRSDGCLTKLLNCGGIDIYAVDSHKMTPYQIALSYKNEHAIKLLMNYESKSKKKQHINTDLLNQPIQLIRQSGFCDSVVQCLIGCFSLNFYRQQDSSNKARLTQRLSTLVSSPTQDGHIDCVKLGSRKQLPGYDIVWKRASEVLNTRNASLFQTYNPLNICQTNFTLRHNLIIFQQISKHPYILRKLITLDKNKPNIYDVHTFPNMISQKIKIDEYIPFIKERNQPMFFSNTSQLWPMLVQKALAKWHQGYLNLNNINPKQLMRQLTGAYTFTMDIDSIHLLMQFLQQLNSKGYCHVLCGKKGSPLADEQDKEECFTVLNFLEQGGKRLVLINCPFILESWREKQKYETLQMKLIRSHYNSHNQMCVWIQVDRFSEYFSKIVISYTLPNYERSELKIRTNKYVFFKFKIDSHKSDDMVLALMDSNSLETFDLNQGSLVGWRNDGAEMLKLSQPQPLAAKLVNIPSKPGQYLCKYEFQENTEKNLLLICWSVDYNQLQFVESQFAVLEWLGSWKRHTTRNWTSDLPYQVNSISGINLLLLREERAEKVYYKNNLSQSQLYEGVSMEGKGIQMVKEGKYFYTVFRSAVGNTQQFLFDLE